MLPSPAIVIVWALGEVNPTYSIVSGVTFVFVSPVNVCVSTNV